MTALSDPVQAERGFGASMRFLTVAIAIAVLSMIAARWLFPETVGSIGMAWFPEPSGQIRIEQVDVGRPAAALGIQKGDVIRVDRMTFADRTALYEPVAGAPFDLTFERGTRLTTVRIVPAPMKTWSRSPAGVTTNVFAVIYLGMALLIAWKAARDRTALLIIVFTLGIALSRAGRGLTAVLSSSTADLISHALGSFALGVVIVAQFLFVATFPPRRTAAPRWSFLLGVAIATATAIVIALETLLPVAFPASTYVVNTAHYALLIANALTVFVVVVQGILQSEAEFRIRSLVAGSTLVLFSAVNGAIGIIYLNHWSVDQTWFLTLQYAVGLGVTYAVLRHRLVDLDLFISRAAIFSVVSLVMVCMFLITEWGLALVLERVIGPKFGEQSQTMLTGIIALGVGLSARNIHRAVEHRLNRLFFAQRFRALAELQRFSHETDAATDAGALVDLTFEQLRRNLDASYVAIYTGRPERGYTLLQNRVSVGPARLDQNHPLVLRLRRWGESFVNDIPADVFCGSILFPMVLRGTLHGFVICGPKRDRTSYAPEERETLESLSHRVGIAYEWLTREAASSEQFILARERSVESSNAKIAIES